MTCPATVLKCLYVAGVTNDTSGVATPGSYKSHFVVTNWNYGSNTYVRYDVFLARFDTLGHCLWSTYYGGTGDEMAPDLTVDTNGNVYLCGLTTGDNGISTNGSYRPHFPGDTGVVISGIDDVVPFLVKFDSSGNLKWGTYLGGDSAIMQGVVTAYNPIKVACNRQNNKIYVLGLTQSSSGIATPGAFKETQDTGYYDLFLAEFNTAGIKQWATYYGGEKGAQCGNCSLYIDNTGGDIYFLGYTKSQTGIATAGTAATTLTDAVLGNLFLAKFNSSGQRQWGTYIPNTINTTGLSIIGGSHNEIYVSGYTIADSGIATQGAYQDTLIGQNNAFLMQFNAATGQKNWGTYYGGGEEFHLNFNIPYSATIPSANLAIDKKGHILMVGSTTSPQHIEKGCHPYPVNPAAHRIGFITQWNSNGDLGWGSYYNVGIKAVAAAGNAAFYLVGATTFDSLATPGTAQTNKTLGKPSGYIAKLSENMYCPPEHFPVTQQNNILSVNSGYYSYQWYHNGTSIPGADQPEYTAADSGAFYVVITTDSCGCSYHSDTVIVGPTGIAAFRNPQLAAFLYPNPNNGKFILSCNLPNNEKISQIHYELTDIVGRVLLNSSFTVNKNSFRKAFDFSSLTSGVYFLKISCNSGFKIIKFVKS